MAFVAEQRTVSNKLLTSVVYGIPRNQRKYVWNELNWEELWNDLRFICGDDNKAHFLGSIVLMDKGEIEGIQHYDIIDGQQRIITLIILVAAIMQLYKERGEQDLFLGLKRFIVSTDLQNRVFCKVESEFQPSIEDILKVVSDSNRNDSVSMILNAIYNSKDDKIANCFSFFYDKLSSLDTNEIRNIQKGLLRTNYIDIIALTEEDSYTVFEILNARGMELEDHELLKNYIMRYTVPTTAIDRVKQEWLDRIERPLNQGIKKFLIHYARHRYRTNGTIDAYNTIKINNNATTINALFDDLKKKASFYSKIINPVLIRDGGECSDVEYRVFKFLKSNRGELFRPVLLSLMHQRDIGAITVQEYEKALLFIHFYFTCYNLILQETSNKISDSIQKYAYILENEYSREKLLEFVQYLVSKMPQRETFYNAFKLLGWSNNNKAYKDNSRKKKVQIALSSLESIASSIDIVPDFTIEHIIPDSATGNNALIGNLLPLEDNLNKNCENKPINEKLQYYRQSNFRITRDFASYYSKNGGFDLNSRAVQMAKRIFDFFDSIARYFS